jgi:hypothetical protein
VWVTAKCSGHHTHLYLHEDPGTEEVLVEMLIAHPLDAAGWEFRAELGAVGEGGESPGIVQGGPEVVAVGFQESCWEGV